MKYFQIILFIVSFEIVESIWLISLLDKNVWKNLTDSSSICQLAPTTKTQRLCSKSPQALRLISSALEEAVGECRQQFAHDKWDCGLRSGLEDAHLKVPGKESALFYALISGSSSRAISKACSQGKLLDCSCGKMPGNKNSPFIWAGCSDNVQFGNRLTRQILDSAEDKQNANSLMNIHNNRAGRKLLAKQVQQKCKCHGVSGSCSMKTCWTIVPELTNLVSILHQKYQKASQVELVSNASSLILVSDNQTLSTSQSRNQRSLVSKNGKKPALNDLVFIQESPDLCKMKKNGIPMIAGRECSNEEKCNRLCCNRGFIRIREVHRERCNCQFIYCCRVECDECPKEVNRFYCK